MSQFIAEVSPSLWIGSYHLETLPIVDKVVVCSKEPIRLEKQFPHADCVYAPLSPYIPTEDDIRTAVQTGRFVAGWVKRQKRVLVTCSTGRNRAAVIAAIAIMTYGISCQDAVTLIRTAVPDALNDMFLRMLYRLQDASTLQISRPEL